MSRVWRPNETQCWWFLLGAKPNADGSKCQQDTLLLGVAEAGPKAIGSCWAAGPKAIGCCLGQDPTLLGPAIRFDCVARPNIFGCGWGARPNIIGSGGRGRPSKLGSGCGARMGSTKARPKAIGSCYAAGPKAILRRVEGMTQHYWILLGSRNQSYGVLLDS